MQNRFADDLVRTLSKTGGFVLASPESLDWACSLDDEEQVELYCKLRDESQRIEDEWRYDFIDLVEIDDELLPDPE